MLLNPPKMIHNMKMYEKLWSMLQLAFYLQNTIKG